MKFSSCSLLILIASLPLICSGLKCYTCNGDVNWRPDSDLRDTPCTIRQQQGQDPKLTVECGSDPDMVCTLYQPIDRNGLKPTIDLGCKKRNDINVWGYVKDYHGSLPNVCGEGGGTAVKKCICFTDLCNNPGSLKCLYCKDSWNDNCNETAALITSEKSCFFDEVCMRGRKRSGEVNMGCIPGRELENMRKINKPTQNGYYINTGAEIDKNEGEWELFVCNSNLCNTHYRDPNHPEEPYKNAGGSDPKILPFTLTLAVSLVSVYYS